VKAPEDRLLNDLAALLGYLQVPGMDDAVRPTADAFVRGLADHLRREEDLLFPSLSEAYPAAEGRLSPLRDDHAMLRRSAEDLARRVALNDRVGASEIARGCLAALARHLQREDRDLDEVLEELQPETADGLLRRAGGLSGAD
jgi:hemerythrin-like domain-containing protein